MRVVSCVLFVIVVWMITLGTLVCIAGLVRQCQ
jgi:hypothetical protein